MFDCHIAQRIAKAYHFIASCLHYANFDLGTAFLKFSVITKVRANDFCTCSFFLEELFICECQFPSRKLTIYYDRGPRGICMPNANTTRNWRITRWDPILCGRYVWKAVSSRIVPCVELSRHGCIFSFRSAIVSRNPLIECFCNTAPPSTTRH